MSKIIWMLVAVTMASLTLAACKSSPQPLTNWGQDGGEVP